MKSVNKSLDCQYLKDNEIKCLFDVGYDLDLMTDEKVTVLFMNNTRVGGSPFKNLLRRMESRVLKKSGHTTDFPLACSNLSGGFKFIPSKSQKIRKVIGYNIGLRSQFAKDQSVFAAKELAKAHSGSIDRAVDSYHTSFEAAEYGKYDARIEFRVVQDDIVSTIRRIEQKLGKLLERTTHPSVVVYPSNHLFQMMATRMELCLLLAKQLGKQKDHASFSGLVFLSYYLKCQVHSVDPAWSQYKEVASFLRGYSCANNDFMFVPKVFKVLSNGRVQFRHVFSQQTLSNLLPDYQTPVLLVPNATHRINVNDSTVSDLAQLVVATSKRKVRLPDVRVLALPLKGREYSQDYLSLFVDVLSIGYGLSSLGAAHCVKILLEEFLEHFLPTTMVSSYADKSSWQCFNSFDALGGVKGLNLKEFKKLRGSRNADPKVIFEKLIPGVEPSQRTMAKIEKIITLNSSGNAWVGFITRNHFLNLYLRKDIPLSELNEFGDNVKTLLAHFCKWFPHVSAKSVVQKAKKRYELYTLDTPPEGLEDDEDDEYNEDSENDEEDEVNED